MYGITHMYRACYSPNWIWHCNAHLTNQLFTFTAVHGLLQAFTLIQHPQIITCGPGSSVVIATGYGMDGPGIESRWGGEIFRTCPDRPWGPPSLLYNGYRVFPGGKEQPGRDADHSPPSSAVVMKG